MSSILQKAERFAHYVQREGAGKGMKFAWWKLRSAVASSELGWNIFFRRNPFVTTGEVSDYRNSAEQVWQSLKQIPDLKLEEWYLDVSKYRDYVVRARYEQFDPYYRGGMSGDDTHRTEKLLQHYISLELLRIQQNDVYIDVASNTSPMRHIVRNLFGVKSYSLDLSYQPGVHGELIGADAGAMPLSDGFVSKMTLHCSFEHFAYGADSRFVRECSRVLSPGGKVCIVPLYILPDYCVRVDPTLEMDTSVGDLEGAVKTYVRGYRVDYGRFYSPQSFRDRILSHAAGLNVTMYRIRGLEQLAPDNVYSHFALVVSR